MASMASGTELMIDGIIFHEQTGTVHAVRENVSRQKHAHAQTILGKSRAAHKELP